jgi:transposase
MRAVEAKHARKIEAHGGCRGTGRVACPVEIGAPRRSGSGAGDPRPAPGQALLTLEGRRAEEIAAVLGVHISTVRNWRGYFAHGGVAGLRRRPRPGQQAKIGPHAGAIAATILTEDARHDGGWTLPRLCAEIARRGGPAISPRWLSHQLRQRGLPGGGRVTPSKGARTQWRSRRAVGASPI